ncbi:MAG: hypothetical protein GX316_04325 [Firmicutes bacterium]|nr:hypothetical protein [Bacillota bacterium]
MSKKRRKRSKRTRSFGKMINETMDSLEQVKEVLATVASIASSLHILVGTYRKIQDSYAVVDMESEPVRLQDTSHTFDNMNEIRAVCIESET